MVLGRSCSTNRPCRFGCLFIDQHDSTATSSEVSRDTFLEGKEIEPVGTTLALVGHPQIEVIERSRVLLKPLEKRVLGIEAILESAILWVSRVLESSPSKKGRKSHGGGSDDVIRMVDTRFKPGDGQISCDFRWDIAVGASFTDDACRDKISKETEE